MKIKWMIMGLLAAMLASPVMGAKVLIDFGDDTSWHGASAASPDSNGNYWNSVDSTKYWSNLTNSSGSATAFSFGFGTPGGADSYNGPAGATSSGADYTNAVIDAAALGVFGNQAATFDFYTSSTFTIQNLNPAKTYNLTFFGSHKWSTDDATVYTVYTSNDYSTAVSSASLNVQTPGSPWLHNSNTVVTISNVSPQYANSVWIGFKGSSGINPGYINAMSIEEVQSYTLTVSAGAHGTISPATTNVLAGSSVNFTITADSGYRILTLTTNGTAVTGMSFDNNSTTTNLVLNNVQTNIIVAATFIAKGAELVLIDFGDSASYRGYSAASPDSNGNYWNSIDSTKYWSNLTNSAGTATTINFGFGTAGGTDSYNGPAGATAITGPGNASTSYTNAVIDAAALGVFGNQAAAFDYYTSSTFTIQGLNPAKTYNLTFFGSHKYSTDDATVYTVYTSNDYLTAVTSASLNVQTPGASWRHNSNTVVTISNVSPQYAGSIWIGFKGSAGSSGYINAMSIEVVPTCTLTVNSGTGGGEYTNGALVAIEAGAVYGKTFAAWAGDTQYVASASFASTTVTMLTNAITLTATYTDNMYSLTVTSGSGGGSYTNGHQVAISAEAPASGYAFDKWTGDTQGVASVSSASTTITMPAQNVAVTATYIVTEQYTTNGTPCLWLDQYGLTNYVADDILDPDSDGLKTWQEYIAGTNPTNSESCLKAVQAVRNIITWSAVSGRVYSVYWSTNLVQGFTALSTNIVSPQSSYTNVTPDSRVNYYQVRVRLQ
jgi:hypothetical protein